jgi:hypothetical protein
VAVLNPMNFVLVVRGDIQRCKAPVSDDAIAFAKDMNWQLG